MVEKVPLDLRVLHILRLNNGYEQACCFQMDT